jgi:predicted amidohydrolase
MNSAGLEAWFPDYVARWADRLPKHLTDRYYGEWYERWSPEAAEWSERLVSRHNDPHAVALEMERRIARASDQKQALYEALQAASQAFDRAGIRPVREQCGAGWMAIRRHWLRTGQLNTDQVPGLLVPTRDRPFAWPGPRRSYKHYELSHHFGAFLRWRGEQELKVSIKVVPDLDPRLQREAENGTLIGAVIPLISSREDFEFPELQQPNRFEVVIKDPARIAELAKVALREAIEAGAQLIVFPELCLTREAQMELGDVVREVSNGRVWLVVTGSAITAERQNQSVVFDGQGRAVIWHNKLFPYSISTDEQDRYGILSGFSRRVEDINPNPRELYILETQLGRVAVLICEDLTVPEVFVPIFKSLEVDLLVVPLMDGPQLPERWSGQYGSRYARECQVSVLTATTESFARTAAEPEVGLYYSRNRPGTPEVLTLSGGRRFVPFLLK